MPQLADGVFAITLFILGACIGSFLNVVVYRLPAGLSLISPPSRCPKCEKPIRAFDNVPILGWVLLRGRCRGCSVWIPMRYPFVELATALLFAYAGWTRGNQPDAQDIAVPYDAVTYDVRESDLFGELANKLNGNGWAILLSLSAASLLVIAICWYLDRVRIPLWFFVLSAGVTVGAIVLSSNPREGAVYAVLGAMAFLPYAMVRRKWNHRVPWQNLLIAGVLAAVLIALR